MTQREVRDLIALVIHLWPSVPYRNDEHAPLIVSWHLVLTDVALTEATLIVRDAARDGQPFPPTPGAIAKQVLDARDRAAGTLAPDADEAWAEVQRGVSSHGYVNGQPQWSHPAIGAVVSAITWRELCLSTMGDVVRAHFLRLYEAAVRRVVADQRRQSDEAFVLGAAPRNTPELS